MFGNLFNRLLKRKPKIDLEEMARKSSDPLETLRLLHAKGLSSNDQDLILATTTAIGIVQGMSSMAEQSGAQRREMIEMFAAVVYAAGGSVSVQPYHIAQVPGLVLTSERQLDGSILWQSGVRH